MNSIKSSLKMHVKQLIAIVGKILSLATPFKRSICTAESKRCEYDFFNKNYRNSVLGFDSAPCCNQHLYELLDKISKALDAEGLEYYVFYGTLLGAVRHQGGFIPWDTDVDICVMEKDRTKVRSVIRERLGHLHPCKTINENWDMIDFSEKNKVHADIYYMSIKDGYIYLKGYEDIRYTKEQIFPLKRISIYDLVVGAPCDSNSISNKYGDDFLSSAYRQYAIFQKKTRDFYPAKLLKDIKCESNN